MQQENLNIKYTVLNLNELSAEDKKLVEHAAATTQKAYSPYSRFRVGAAVLMDNGSMRCEPGKHSLSERIVCRTHCLVCLCHAGGKSRSHSHKCKG